MVVATWWCAVGELTPEQRRRARDLTKAAPAWSDEKFLRLTDLVGLQLDQEPRREEGQPDGQDEDRDHEREQDQDIDEGVAMRADHDDPQCSQCEDSGQSCRACGGP